MASTASNPLCYLLVLLLLVRVLGQVFYQMREVDGEALRVVPNDVLRFPARPDPARLLVQPDKGLADIGRMLPLSW